MTSERYSPRVVLGFVAGWLCFHPMHTQAVQALENSAGPVATAPEALNIYVFGDTLQNVIRELVKGSDLAVKVSDKIDGYVSKRRFAGTQTGILNELAAEFGFEWFIHNQTLYISSRRESTTRVLPLGDLKSDRVMEALKTAGLDTQQFPIRNLQDNKTLVVSAPPSYVALTEAIIQSLQTPKDAPKTSVLGNSVTVYRGAKRENVEID